MTISTEAAPLSYAGNGSTTAFPITWKYLAKSHVAVTLRSSVGGETSWVLDTDYTLTAAGNDAGGTLTATTAPATNTTLVIELDPPNTQTQDYPLGGAFPSSNVEDGLDLSAQRDAKLESLFNRSLMVPKTDTQTGTELELPIDSERANKYLKFDSAGAPTASVLTGISDFTSLVGNTQVFWCGTATGTANALVLTPTGAVSALTAGLTLLFKSSASANTSAVTINVSGLGATIARLNNAACVAGDIEANQYYLTVLDAAGIFQIQKIGIPALIHALTIDGVLTINGASTIDGVLTINGASTINNLLTLKTGANIASAATLDLTAATGNMPVHITGTTPTSAVTMNPGQFMQCISDGAWPLTFHATTNKINTDGTNITLEAGDRVFYFYDGTTVYGNIVKNSGPVIASKIVTATRDISLASGTQSITGVGFKPRAIVVIGGIDLSNNFFWGIADSTSQRVVYDWYQINPDTYTYGASTFIEVRVTNPNIYSGAITSWDSGGITITWTKTGSPTGTITMLFLFLR